ncbi:MAG: hypothetical protein WAM79_23160 [Candidatus Sulfotelmatobacter sp.]
MKLSKLVRSALKTAIYIIDQTADQVERVSDRASEMADNARDTLTSQQSHPLRNVLSFAAGVGVGVGVGMLLAPSSGAELRGNITGKVQDIGNRVTGRGEAYATGTDMR